VPASRAPERAPLLVGAALAQRPGVGGHAWFVLQWLLGLRRLGFDPVLVDRVVGPDGDARRQVDWVRSVLEPFGLGGSWSVRLPGGGTAGLPTSEVVARAGASPLLLNVMGFADDEAVLAAVPVRVFLDIDPGFGQLWFDLGLADPFAGHDRFVTVGTAINDLTSTVPRCGREWLTTLPPIVLEHCPVAPPPPDERFTSVASWRGPFGPIDHGGRTYGLRVHELRRFVSLPMPGGAVLPGLPGRSGPTFELALDIDPGETSDLRLLAEHGWRLVDPAEVAGDVQRYLGFIAASTAEIQVAKNLYVDTRVGWFSDRSATYLAMGRPVVAQDTGFGPHVPTGEGLLSFTTLEEAREAVETVLRRLPAHAAAARRLAERHLDSDLVIADLMTRLTR
jgi:hypothetical protein